VEKLLGLTVIDKEEVALKRMTANLKKERKAPTNQARDYLICPDIDTLGKLKSIVYVLNNW